MADAHGSGPCVRKDVRVQLPPRPPAGPWSPNRLPRGLIIFGGRTPQTPTVRWLRCVGSLRWWSVPGLLTDQLFSFVRYEGRGRGGQFHPAVVGPRLLLALGSVSGLVSDQLFGS